MQDWVLYFNDDQYGFSDAFKLALSTQLKQQLESELQYERLFDDYFFNLFVGMVDARIEVRDGFTFANAEIISPDSVSREITIAWNQDAAGDYHVFFCDDLPVEQLRGYVAPKQKKRSKIFGVHVDYAGFPDLALRFETRSDFTQPEQDAITAMLESKGVYISDFAENTLMLDFQSSDFSDAQIRAYIDGFFEKLSASAFASKIKSATIA